MDLMNPPGKEQPELPIHLHIGWATRAFYLASCVIAFLLLAGLVYQIVTKSQVFSWYTLLAIPMGMFIADFLSGMVHWGADTWGSESMPILGKRLLHPFRVHHLNPADFLRRRFFDTNGDVAFLAIPFLLLALQLPLTTAASVFGAVLLTSFSAVGLMTNQIHQWAHMRKAPPPICWLQQLGIILSYEAHQQHHGPPFVQNYCIATGWCNRPLQAVQFFTRLERFITLCTGLQPRHDEQEFSQSVFSEKHL
jgi:plasmanylethanolamine desaturase